MTKRQTSSLAASNDSSAAIASDDIATICAISILAFIFTDLIHEALGHGVAALILGARSLTLSSVALSTDISGRLLSASGTLANFLLAGILLFALKRTSGGSIHLRYFRILAFAGNAFVGTGYLLFSGLLNVGDWADVISGFQPAWIFRSTLVVLGVVSYYSAARVTAAQMRLLVTGRHSSRITSLTVLPYIAMALISLLAGAMNPLGLNGILQSALPAGAGANVGLLFLRGMMPATSEGELDSRQITRNFLWIGLACLFGLFFVFVLGPGVHWNRG